MGKIKDLINVKTYKELELIQVRIDPEMKKKVLSKMKKDKIKTMKSLIIASLDKYLSE